MYINPCTYTYLQFHTYLYVYTYKIIILTPLIAIQQHKSSSRLSPFLVTLFFNNQKPGSQYLKCLLIFSILVYSKSSLNVVNRFLETGTLTDAILRGPYPLRLGQLHTNSPNMHIFRMWEETRAPGENPYRHWVHVQTPHRQ